MSGPIFGLIALAAWLVLAGRGVLTRRRRGEPIGRYGLIWVALFGIAFAAALLIDRHVVRS